MAPVHAKKKFRLAARDVGVLHQQIDQLAVADPEFVHLVAVIVGVIFGRLLHAGQVVPVVKPRR